LAAQTWWQKGRSGCRAKSIHSSTRSCLATAVGLASTQVSSRLRVDPTTPARSKPGYEQESPGRLAACRETRILLRTTVLFQPPALAGFHLSFTGNSIPFFIMISMQSETYCSQMKTVAQRSASAPHIGCCRRRTVNRGRTLVPRFQLGYGV
jgi:hypothetical protein